MSIRVGACAAGTCRPDAARVRDPRVGAGAAISWGVSVENAGVFISLTREKKVDKMGRFIKAARVVRICSE